MTNLITFECDDEDLVKHFPPKPAKKLVPQWYKDTPLNESEVLGAGPEDKADTIKNCPPVTDYLTSGYIIPNAYQAEIHPKIQNGVVEHYSKTPIPNYIGKHSYMQCPVHTAGLKQHFFKIANPWIVKTPPGYSCLFIQPVFHIEERFTLMSAIVDTDKHDMAVQFPGWAHSKESFTIMPGEPLMHVIPFKRDEWTSEVVARKKSFMAKFFNLGDWHYKDWFRAKKKFD
jgi:hypothetical protein